MNEDGDDNLSVSNVSMNDLLPITVNLKFKDNVSTKENSATEIKAKDIIVFVFIDQYKNTIPIKLEVTRTDGIFFCKNLIGIQLTVTRKTGTLEPEIKQAIAGYLEDFKELPKI